MNLLNLFSFLWKKKNSWKTLLNLLPQGIAIFNNDKKIIYSNEAILHILDEKNQISLEKSIMVKKNLEINNTLDIKKKEKEPITQLMSSTALYPSSNNFKSNHKRNSTSNMKKELNFKDILEIYMTKKIKISKSNFFDKIFGTYGQRPSKVSKASKDSSPNLNSSINKVFFIEE